MQLPVRLPRLFPLFSLFFPFESTHPSLEGHFYPRKEEEKDTSILKKKKKIYLVWKNVSKENDSLSGKKKSKKSVSPCNEEGGRKKSSFPAKPRIECKSFPSEADNYAPRRPTSSCSSLCDFKEARGGGSTGREFVLGSGRTLPPPRPSLLPPRRPGTRGGGHSARCCEPVCRCSQIFVVRRTDDIAFIFPFLRLFTFYLFCDFTSLFDNICISRTHEFRLSEDDFQHLLIFCKIHIEVGHYSNWPDATGVSILPFQWHNDDFPLS